MVFSKSKEIENLAKTLENKLRLSQDMLSLRELSHFPMQLGSMYGKLYISDGFPLKKLNTSAVNIYLHSAKESTVKARIVLCRGFPAR